MTGRIGQQKTPSVAGGVFGSDDAAGSGGKAAAHPAVEGGGSRPGAATDAAHGANIAIGRSPVKLCAGHGSRSWLLSRNRGLHRDCGSRKTYLSSQTSSMRPPL